MEIESNFYPPNISVKSLSTKEAEVNMSADPSKDSQLSQSGSGQTLIKNSIQSQNFIHNTAGWQLNANGTFEFNPISRCRVVLEGEQTITPGGARKIAFGSIIYDNLSEFDATTNFRFTVKNAGYYLIYSLCRFDPSAAGISYTLQIKKNGTTFMSRVVTYSLTTGVFSIQVSDILGLVVGDYIEVFVDSAEAGDVTCVGGANITILDIHRLS